MGVEGQWEGVKEGGGEWGGWKCVREREREKEGGKPKEGEREGCS